MSNTRRQFLKHALGAAAACSTTRLATANEPVPLPPLVDTHVYLGHWPHKPLTSEHPAKLADDLRNSGVIRAWAGSFDGLFHKDIAAVNQRLADACTKFGDGLFIAIGTINPNLPDWEDDVRRCHEVHNMPGVRLHPNYHGYTLDDPRFAKLLNLASERALVVQIVTSMEQTKHLLLNPHGESVNLSPLPKAQADNGKAKVLLSNTFEKADDKKTQPLLSHSSIWFDFARAQSSAELSQLVSQASRDRVVFGSSAPLHDVDNAITNVRQAQLAQSDVQAIAAGNAVNLIRRN